GWTTSSMESHWRSDDAEPRRPRTRAHPHQQLSVAGGRFIGAGLLLRKETLMRRLGSINALLVVLAALSLAIDPRPAMAAWPAFGRAIGAAPGNQDDAQAATDGAGGAIITWVDAASGVVDLFAQHVLAS